VATQAEGQGADPIGSGLAVHQPGLRLVPHAPQSGSLDEPTRQCHDKVVAQSFFNLLKRERIRLRVYRSRDEARQDVFDYMEMSYNPKRKLVRNGILSPVEFEKQQKI
jgi:putative transposase